MDRLHLNPIAPGQRPPPDPDKQEGTSAENSETKSIAPKSRMQRLRRVFDTELCQCPHFDR